MDWRQVHRQYLQAVETAFTLEMYLKAFFDTYLFTVTKGGPRISCARGNNSQKSGTNSKMFCKNSIKLRKRIVHRVASTLAHATPPHTPQLGLAKVAHVHALRWGSVPWWPYSVGVPTPKDAKLLLGKLFPKNASEWRNFGGEERVSMCLLDPPMLLVNYNFSCTI